MWIIFYLKHLPDNHIKTPPNLQFFILQALKCAFFLYKYRCPISVSTDVNSKKKRLLFMLESVLLALPYPKFLDTPDISFPQSV